MLQMTAGTDPAELGTSTSPAETIVQKLTRRFRERAVRLQHRKHMRALLELDDWTLADIGLTRDQVRSCLNLPCEADRSAG